MTFLIKVFNQFIYKASIIFNLHNDLAGSRTEKDSLEAKSLTQIKFK